MADIDDGVRLRNPDSSRAPERSAEEGAKTTARQEAEASWGAEERRGCQHFSRLEGNSPLLCSTLLYSRRELQKIDTTKGLAESSMFMT